VLRDSASNSRPCLYDCQSASNRIESFQLADGSVSLAQVQQKVTTLGAAVTNSTWASWDTTN
jgi:hypothetical protein